MKRLQQPIPSRLYKSSTHNPIIYNQQRFIYLTRACRKHSEITKVAQNYWMIDEGLTSDDCQFVKQCSSSIKTDNAMTDKHSGSCMMKFSNEKLSEFLNEKLKRYFTELGLKLNGDFTFVSYELNYIMDNYEKHVKNGNTMISMIWLTDYDLDVNERFTTSRIILNKLPDFKPKIGRVLIFDSKLFHQLVPQTDDDRMIDVLFVGLNKN